jgi:hypothetical protein
MLTGNPPTLTIGPTPACQSDGSVEDSVTASTSGTMPVELEYLYAYVYPTGTTPDKEPPSGSTVSGPANSISVPNAPTSGTFAVWAEYHGYLMTSVDYDCNNAVRMRLNPVGPLRPAPGSGHPEAVPANMRLAPADGSALPAATGPGPELVGALTRGPEPVLRYVAEASTPAEPLWRALAGTGPVVEATLVLLHRTGGLGALLTIAAMLGDRRVQFTWVTSDWRFNGTNRLRSESDDPGLPALVVSPA